MSTSSTSATPRTIESTVGTDAVRAAFFLGHVEHIGLKPNGDMIDPAAPDAKKFLAPERVKIPTTVRSVGAVSILTGAPETDIVSANPGLPAAGPLPSSAHTTGLFVPGTTHHRTLEVGDRAGTRSWRPRPRSPSSTASASTPSNGPTRPQPPRAHAGRVGVVDSRATDTRRSWIMNELRAYADGRWADFGGLDACTLAEADTELGPPLGPISCTAASSAASRPSSRLYPAAAASPSGVTAWVLGDVVVGLEIREASPAARRWTILERRRP